jgi:D-cysteine desulfhydrase
MPSKIPLIHAPTPLWHSDRLDRLLDAEVWVKRDDMTLGAAAGNKARKLEYLLGDALAQGATRVITCGGEQSNHCRATALLAAELGLKVTVVLRTVSGAAPAEHSGNLMLMRLAGADFRFITRDQYAGRAILLQQLADEYRRDGELTYVIPEGGSNGLGCLGYVDAMAEVKAQLKLGLGPSRFDSVSLACGSGGTAAGVALGSQLHDVARQTDAFAVCDDRSYFQNVISGIFAEALRLRPDLTPGKLAIHDEYVGPGYAVASSEQLEFFKQVARETGLIVDPVYSGKALFGLWKLEDKPHCVLFIHSGGLPGLLAQHNVFYATQPSA